MSYRLEPEETVEDAVRRIALEQIDKAVGEIDDTRDAEETVHEVRKRCKKIRALLRLTRPAFESTYREENALFRDAARGLSELRDATSRLECVDALKDHSGSERPAGLDAVRALLADDRDELYDRVDVSKRLSEFRDHMTGARARAGNWKLDREGFDRVEGGLKKTYRRARLAMNEAAQNPSVESFHGWRKRVKYHRYHIRLLRSLWEPVLEARREALHRLSDLLGDAHDLSVLRGWLIEHGERLGAPEELHSALGLVDRRRQALRAHAFPLGRRLLVERPKRFGERARVYWESWRAESKLASELAYTK